MGVDEYSTWTADLDTVDLAIDGGQPLLEAVREVWINLQKVPDQWVAFRLRDWFDIVVGHGVDVIAIAKDV